MPRLCSLANCRFKQLPLFEFPSNSIQLKTWVEAISAGTGKFIHPIKQADGLFICSGHFKKDSFIICKNNMRKLKPNSIPTIFTESTEVISSTPESLNPCSQNSCNSLVPTKSDEEQIDIPPTTVQHPNSSYKEMTLLTHSPDILKSPPKVSNLWPSQPAVHSPDIFQEGIMSSVIPASPNNILDTSSSQVTGSNKGIGYAIVEGLCEKFDGDVYLTSRDVSRGEEAVKKLKELGFNPLFHQLDITEQSSVDTFKNYIKTKHGGIDVLVNNAAIAFKAAATEPFSIQAEETVRVNYFGTLRVCEALFPLLRNNARVVNVSSSAGFLGRIPSEDLRKKFGEPTLSVSSLNHLMNKFVKDAQDGKHKSEGWGESAYAVSKVGVSALTLIQQREFDNETPKRNVSVNSVHPGYVDTDMTSHKGTLTIEEGAKAPLWLALEADVKGKYVWKDCHVVDWFGLSTPAIY